MFSTYSVLLPPICSAITLLLCLAAGPLTTKLRLLDIPGGRKSHRRPTPLMGGLVLLFGFYPWVGIWIALNPQPATILLPVVLCAAAVTLLGLIDDRRHLSALLRLTFCFVAIVGALLWAPTLVVRAITWNYDHGSIALQPTVAMIFTILSIVALIQASNLADGKNGLLIGMCLAWIYFLGNALPDNMMPVVLGLSGVLIVLLAFNLAGALFLGDGGSYGLAAFIGFMSLVAAGAPNPHNHAASDQIGLIFLLPVLDMVRLMTVRMARGQSPFVGDRDHLHHHLLAAFGWPGGLAAYLMMVVLPSFIAAGAPRNTLTIIALTVVVYFGVIGYAKRLVRMRNSTAT
nr:MraY family glycosyltransferase [Sphingomonas lycopersici]